MLRLHIGAAGYRRTGPLTTLKRTSADDPLRTLVRAAKLDANVVKEIEVSILKV
jgi:hypothetical protein